MKPRRMFSDLPKKHYDTPAKAENAIRKFLDQPGDNSIMSFVIAAAEDAKGTVRYFPIVLPRADQLDYSMPIASHGFPVART